MGTQPPHTQGEEAQLINTLLSVSWEQQPFQTKFKDSSVNL